ncbi:MULTISPECIES: hypothetical protein [unclassified Duganella]|uniref:hypothetical protein n=1 Tax=unclassified Duganella TaxID=2636909 RepID=UPI000700B996|nr:MULTISPECIES: hypothetical protein [unclassified Duganella]KQV53717.1 hypothetical protein ASD07_03960 [Duganella sp. Root336D2]KRB83728.1 hypothetical protein ASE26_11220 [Duganella sp. Root198D2]
METSTIYVSHALPQRGLLRRVDKALGRVGGLPASVRQASQHMVALELRDDAFCWPCVLQGVGSRAALAGLALRLASAFESSHAIVAPHGGPGAGAAWDDFTADATLPEMLAHLETCAGSCIYLLPDGHLAAPPDARLARGYCVFRKPA